MPSIDLEEKVEGLFADAIQNRGQMSSSQELLNGSTSDARAKLLHATLRMARTKPSVTSAIFTHVVDFLVKAGADLNWRDGGGRTALHVAAKYNSPPLVLKRLASEIQNVNEKDRMSRTPLHCLMMAPDDVNPDSVRVLIRAGGDIEAASTGAYTPLHCLAQRRACDGMESILLALQNEVPRTLEKNLPMLIRHAAALGTAHVLKALLKYVTSTHVVDGGTQWEPTVLLAARSAIDAEEKVVALVTAGFDARLRRESSFDVTAVTSTLSLAHYAASMPSVVVLKIAKERGVDLNGRDVDGNTPLHYATTVAAGSATTSSVDNNSACIRFLADNGADLNAENRDGVVPLVAALTSQQTANVKTLIQCGARLPKPIAANYMSSDAFAMLADPEVIASSPSPVFMTMRLSGFFRRCGAVDLSNSADYMELGDDLESIAIEMVNSNPALMGDDVTSFDEMLLSEAIDNEQKRLIGQPRVQKCMNKLWYDRRSGFSVAHYISMILLYTVKTFACPLLLLVFLPSYRSDFRRFRVDFIGTSAPPCIRQGAVALSYISLVFWIVVDAYWIAADHDSTSPSSFTKRMILVYVVALVVQEIGQLYKQGVRFYFSTVNNQLDVVLLTLFVVAYALDLAGLYVVDEKTRSLAFRVSQHVHAAAGLMVCIRLLGFLEAYRSLGPIQISFRAIGTKALAFLLILSIFLLGFSVSLVYTYSAGTFVVGYENRTTTNQIKSLPLIIVHLWWATFGLVETEDFEVATTPETVMAQLTLTMWLTLSVIVLVNMLIAVITSAFESVQNNSDLEWMFARAATVREIKKSPTIPAPANLLYVIAFSIAYVCTASWRTQKLSSIASNTVNRQTSLEWSEEVDSTAIERLKRIEEVKSLQKPATVENLNEMKENLLREIREIAEIVKRRASESRRGSNAANAVASSSQPSSPMAGSDSYSWFRAKFNSSLWKRTRLESYSSTVGQLGDGESVSSPGGPRRGGGSIYGKRTLQKVPSALPELIDEGEFESNVFEADEEMD